MANLAATFAAPLFATDPTANCRARVLPAVAKTLLYPAATLAREDGQLVRHVHRFADRADHGDAGDRLPFLAHLLAGVAAPALDEGILGEDAALERLHVVLVEPALRGAVQIARVVEHPAGAVRMAEVLEVRDLHLVAVLAVVQVVDHLLGLVEEDELDVESIADRLDVAEEVVVLLLGARDVGGPVDEPGDVRV